MPANEENNPFAHRLRCSTCMTNAVNSRLNPCGHLLCSDCFIRLPTQNQYGVAIPKICPICRTPVTEEPIFYGGFYNKYQKYVNKLTNNF